MKKFISLTLFVFLLTAPACMAKAEMLDSSVAIVNEDVILLSEVEEAGAPIFRQINEEVPPDQIPKALRRARKTVVDQLVKKYLLLQQAAQMNISVTEVEIDQAQGRLLQRSGADMEAFRAELNKIGLTEQRYRENLREQVLTSKLMNYAVRSKVAVPDEKIKEYYDQNYIIKSGGYYLLQIGFSLEREGLPGDPEEAKKTVREQAEKVRNLALKDENFKGLARQYSDLPSAVDGGDLGILQEDEMASYMRAAVVLLKSGDISPVIESPQGYMIFKLLSSSKEGERMGRVPYESAREEIHAILYKQEMEQRYTSWIEEIRNAAYIKIL